MPQIFECEGNCGRSVEISDKDARRMRPTTTGTYRIGTFKIAIHYGHQHSICVDCERAERAGDGPACLYWRGGIGKPPPTTPHRHHAVMLNATVTSYEDYIAVHNDRHRLMAAGQYSRVEASLELHMPPGLDLSSEKNWNRLPRTIRWRDQAGMVREVDLTKRRQRIVHRGADLFRPGESGLSTLTWMRTAARRPWCRTFQPEPGLLATVLRQGRIALSADDGRDGVLRLAEVS